MTKERLEELLGKAVFVSLDIVKDSEANMTDLNRLNYNNQQMIVLKKITETIRDVVIYHTLNGDYEED